MYSWTSPEVHRISHDQYEHCTKQSSLRPFQICRLLAADRSNFSSAIFRVPPNTWTNEKSYTICTTIMQYKNNYVIYVLKIDHMMEDSRHVHTIESNGLQIYEYLRHGSLLTLIVAQTTCSETADFNAISIAEICLFCKFAENSTSDSVRTNFLFFFLPSCRAQIQIPAGIICRTNEAAQLRWRLYRSTMSAVTGDCNVAMCVWHSNSFRI